MSSSALFQVPLPDAGSPVDGESHPVGLVGTVPCCLCPHALAHGSQVHGRIERWKKGSDSSRLYEGNPFSWNTSLAPHKVTQVVSNRDGSILAAATNAGTVSLMRGSDGKVLATRQVSKTSTLLQFLPRFQESCGDTLLIQSQVADMTDDVMNCVLVSNILGAKLNGRPESAAEASRQLKIHAVPRYSSDWKDVTHVTALYQSEALLLLVAVTHQGQFRLLDWDLSQGVLRARQESLPLNLASTDKEWVVDHRLGLSLQTVDHRTYIVFAAFAPGESALGWLDPHSGQCVSHIPLEIRAGQMGVFLPLSSYSSTLAVAMAIKKGSHTQINVYQQVVEDTMGLTVLTKPHLVFSVPVEAPLREVALSQVLQPDEYAFEFQSFVKGCPVVTEVRPSESSLSTIGKMRFLLHVGHFDQAEVLLASLDTDNIDSLASFHPSEVASCRLNSLISGERPHLESITSCLENLAAGAVTLDKRAVEEFAHACRMIPDRALNESSEKQLIIIEKLLRFIDRAVEVEPSLDGGVVKEVETSLRDRKRAIRFVVALPDESISMNLFGVKSTRELISRLFADNQYMLFEKFWNWECSDAISVDLLLEQFVSISSEVDPAGYLPILKNILLPNISSQHELLPILLAWCCETADGMDEKNVGLSAAVEFLTVMQNGVNCLRREVYSSFAIRSPFVEGLQTRMEFPQTTVNASRCSLERKIFAPMSRPSQATPTILQVGGLKAKATKSLVRTIGKWSTIQDIDEDCVDQKLAAAKSLQRARSLGLPYGAIQLREIGSTRRIEDCALELVQSLSREASSHEERSAILLARAKPFCVEIGYSFDDCLNWYISSLCRETEVTSRKIVEAGSVSRCCLGNENKARGTLKVVRAGSLCGMTEKWLIDLSRDAIEWASSDSSLRSEMEEAARLLLIDSIIIQYCGKAAKELFRVENPRHAMNLLEFVVRKVETPEQTRDILDLCDAFLHLEKKDCLVSLLQQGILRGDSILSIGVIEFLYETEPKLADNVLVGAISFVIELLSDYCTAKEDDGCFRILRRESVIQATSISGALLATAVQHNRKLSPDFDCGVYCHTNRQSLSGLRDDLFRLHELQTRHNIFVRFSCFLSAKMQINVTDQLLRLSSHAFVEEDDKGFLTSMKKAERACLLLTSHDSAQKRAIWRIASTLVGEDLSGRIDPDILFKLLGISGILRKDQNHVACACLLRLVKVLTSDRSQPQEDYSGHFRQACELSLASVLIREWGLPMSTSTNLPSVVQFDSFLENCQCIVAMIDGGIGERVIQFRGTLAESVSKTSCHQRMCGTLGNLGVFQPSLHPTWYHGDGLLLPVGTTLRLKSFIQWFLSGKVSSSQDFVDLDQLMEEKGSIYSRLRLLGTFWSNKLLSPLVSVSSEIADDAILDFERTLQGLTERSLGGAGVGMTNGVIDSELSVTFLLALPSKLAFKIYTSTIPIALKTHQPRRLCVLSKIGTALCTGACGMIQESHRSYAWSKQHKFLEQCRSLSLQASWWIRLSDFGVDFEPSKFKHSSESIGEDKHYVSSLIPSIVSTLSERFDAQTVREIASSYSEEFKVDSKTVVQSQLEYMERPSSNSSESSDASNHVGYNDTAFPPIVARLLQPKDRVHSLRLCVMAFEQQDYPIIDYDRFSGVLLMYREALLSLLLEKDTDNSTKFEVELELVDRRRDALDILLSFFTGSRIPCRPDFKGFFKPFNESTTESSAIDNSHVNVLGCREGEFDPLSPLKPTMASAENLVASSALSPLCTTLGLPQGYVRARFLMTRFNLAMKNDTSLPSFENEVDILLEKLRSFHDKTVLAEWFAERYVSDDDRLKCYEVALRSAMQYSSEIEVRRRTTPGLADLETKSLESVRRITNMKSSISDKMRVIAILRSRTVVKGGSLDRILAALVESLNDECISSPESLLDVLLQKSSSLVANWTMDTTKSITTFQIRQLADLVTTACAALAEQHSHVDPEGHTRFLASSWLFGGDSDCPNPKHETTERSVFTSASHASTLQNQDENDTIDFELDLAGLGQDDRVDWPSATQHRENRCQTSEEEPSALRECSSREISEIDTQISALRIAFVLSCATEKSRVVDENVAPTELREANDSGRKKKFGLLSRMGTSRDSSNGIETTQQLGHNLLRVAFANKSFKIGDAFNDSSYSISNDADGISTKTITYSMRHRALRAASFLCPQEILEEICHCEGYLRLPLENKDATLAQCSFGSFVAKEIEEMGLQLPHSDLPQLSTMTFPSYARTLWRHNRDASLRKSMGRFLLLLTEMALRDATVDVEFLGLLLKETSRLSLPRTNLFVLDRIARSQHGQTCKESEDCRDGLWALLESTANAVLSEVFALTSCTSSPTEELFRAAGQSIQNLSKTMINICGIEQESKLRHFVKILTQLLTMCTNVFLNDCVKIVLEDVRRHLTSLSITLCCSV